MEEALKACIMLQNYSDENFEVFLEGDDDQIVEIINNRERFIESLVNLEYKIDIILDEVDDYGSGETLPTDVDEIRRSIRSVLSEISVKDMEIMKLISGKMQMYKIETLKARNKKSLSAYMRSSQIEEPGDSIDLFE
jgi:hypothetical protein